jgi:hypothetical protein
VVREGRLGAQLTLELAGGRAPRLCRPSKVVVRAVSVARVDNRFWLTKKIP